MRNMFATSLLVMLMIGGSAARSAAQQSPATPSPHPDSDLAPGLLPEPKAIGRAIDFAGPLLGGVDGSSKDGFYPELGGMITAPAGFRVDRATVDTFWTVTSWSMGRPRFRGARTRTRKHESS